MQDTRQLYLVFCTERNEEPPGLIVRSVLAENEQDAGEKVEDYHLHLDGEFVIVSIFTPAEVLGLVASALQNKPDIP
jgi:hypothetical protein